MTELLDLELVERLEHVADQPPLGAGLIAGAASVEDLDARSRQLPLVGESVEEVAAEARGGVDDHRVEATYQAKLRIRFSFRIQRAREVRSANDQG